MIEVIALARISRQIRLEPEVEEDVQKIADAEGRSFSNCANWLLKEAARRYIEGHPDVRKS